MAEKNYIVFQLKELDKTLKGLTNEDSHRIGDIIAHAILASQLDQSLAGDAELWLKTQSED